MSVKPKCVPASAVWVLYVIACFTTMANAQFNVNWPTQPTTPLATDVQPGSQTLRISNVNDFLYTYDVNIVEKGTPVQVGTAPAGAAGSCTDNNVTTYVADVESAYAAYQKMFPTAATPAKSLLQTQTDWDTNVQPTYTKLVAEQSAALAAANNLTGAMKGFCLGAVSGAKPHHDELDAAKQKLAQPHTVQVSFLAKSCKSEVITVLEKYKGVPTGQSVTAQFDVECDQITVGGGALLTEIQNRTYTSSALPGQTGQFLSVGGTGHFRPTLLVALTNFNFPVEPFGHKTTSALGDMRLGVSTGPVVQNSTSGVSSLGWFIGASTSFVRRLYITPGVHFGEFADFPAGFGPGQLIPANFGTLTPVKRWTGRFSIGITIKGWDASKTFKGGADQPPTK